VGGVGSEGQKNPPDEKRTVSECVPSETEKFAEMDWGKRKRGRKGEVAFEWDWTGEGKGVHIREGGKGIPLLKRGLQCSGRKGRGAHTLHPQHQEHIWSSRTAQPQENPPTGGNPFEMGGLAKKARTGKRGGGGEKPLGWS